MAEKVNSKKQGIITEPPDRDNLPIRRKDKAVEDDEYDELLSHNLQNDGDADRFDEAYMGVKKQFRPDWLNNENKIFINKLNFVAKNYEQTHKSVS